MTEKLLSWGFVPAGSCNCNGQKNYKFKRNEWLVYVTATKFKVKKHGSTIKGYANIEGLETYIQRAIPSIFN